ncbi:TPA: winged helix-turn-helix domain-containing protein [Serratia fonticola]|uniref:winged helix-turn-helix domain-containing protein n=1 Tax=Serratia fonticola TaxID=47917 RepID=UPI00217A54C6|nr:hypothetical protein [Serratia fonticola]CAI1543875.1 Uncharacterised protein [Serratia fonticola]CAI1732130.1 Uncharacterised protein [Serratia fonticola]CAI1995313.1 Uncharacterised protein [Serratia fonticola]CAI2002835.1 Uncharacterised protein [Serratia fonticola]
MMETLIKDRDKLKKYSLIIENRTLTLNNSRKAVKLSKNQAKLLLCLINEIQEKQTIINYIWGMAHAETNASNYRQLVRRTRAILATTGFPEDTIVTIPNYGLCINNKLIENSEAPNKLSMNIYNDHAVL